MKKVSFDFYGTLDRKVQSFAIHLDDDVHEPMFIFESNDSCKPINVNYFDWENSCLQLIE